MTWSKSPETTIKKGNDTYILVPELNYKNYKALEKIEPNTEKLAKIQVIKSENGSFLNGLMWFGIGALAGGLAVSIK